MPGSRAPARWRWCTLTGMTPCIRRAVPALFLAALASAVALTGCALPESEPGGAAPSASGQNAPAGEGLFEHPEDVTVGTCVRDELTGWPKATLTIKNGSSKASSYSVTVSFQSPDGKTQFGEGLAGVTRLEPGQSTTQDAQGLAEVPAGAEFTCVVTSAKRTEAF